MVSLECQEFPRIPKWVISSFVLQDLDFWLGEVDSLLSTDESGKDLASVQNLTKKHQLLEADILAHEERISDMNEQADSLVSCEQFDTDDIGKWNF